MIAGVAGDAAGVRAHVDEREVIGRRIDRRRVRAIGEALEDIEQQRAGGLGADQIGARLVVDVAGPHDRRVARARAGRPRIAKPEARAAGLPVDRGRQTVDLAALRKIGAVFQRQRIARQPRRAGAEDRLRSADRIRRRRAQRQVGAVVGERRVQATPASSSGVTSMPPTITDNPNWPGAPCAPATPIRASSPRNGSTPICCSRSMNGMLSDRDSASRNVTSPAQSPSKLRGRNVPYCVGTSATR